jgi:hypothetical protein
MTQWRYQKCERAFTVAGAVDDLHILPDYLTLSQHPIRAILYWNLWYLLSVYFTYGKSLNAGSLSAASCSFNAKI